MREALERVSAKTLPAMHRIALYVLATYARPDGSDCFPPVKRARSQAGMGERAWYRVMRELEAARWIERTHQFRPNRGGKSSNRYALYLRGGPIVVTSRRTGLGLAQKPLSADVLSAQGVTPIAAHRARTANAAPHK